MLSFDVFSRNSRCSRRLSLEANDWFSSYRAAILFMSMKMIKSALKLLFPIVCATYDLTHMDTPSVVPSVWLMCLASDRTTFFCSLCILPINPLPDESL